MFRVVAENSNGARSGAVLNFTPRAVIGISSDPPTDVTQKSATLNGSFDPNGEDTHYYFEWGTDTTYGDTSADPPGLDAGSTAGSTDFSFGLEGLTAFTTYHYRIVASNSLGTSLGPDRTFRTEAPMLPGVSSTAVSDVGPTGATLSAEITPGFGDTVYVFEYGPTDEYGFATDVSDSIGSDNDPHSVTADLTGLAPGTTYFARAVAINFGGTTHGAPATFVTPEATSAGGGSGRGRAARGHTADPADRGEAAGVRRGEARAEREQLRQTREAAARSRAQARPARGQRLSPTGRAPQETSAEVG